MNLSARSISWIPHVKKFWHVFCGGEEAKRRLAGTVVREDHLHGEVVTERPEARARRP